MVTTNKNELWKTVRWTSFQKPQLQSVAFFFKFFHPCFLQYLQCHLHLLQTFRAVMHQSIPAPPPPTPRLLRGICLPFQSRGWGICNFCSARGPCICQLPGLFPSFWHARGTHLPSFFVPTPGDLTTEEPPPPGIWYQAKKKIANARESAGDGGGGELGLRAAGRSWNWLMQYFDDSLNFSGCNSHRLSFDIEFRDTSPLTLLLVVNAINAQGSCADHRRPLWNPVVVIVVRSPKRYSYLYGTGFWGVFLDEAFTWIRVHYSRDIQFWLVVISSQDQSINFGKKKRKD